MATPAPIELSSLGMADSLILMVLALVVFGPRRLPQIGRQIGKLMYEFRKASNDFKFQMEEELRLAEETDRRKQEDATRQQTAFAAPAPIEAQASIGAVESAPTLPYPAESSYPEQYPPETAAAEPEEVIHLPRVAAPIIQPPSTGAPVAAARPNAVAQPTPEQTADTVAETNIGAEAPANPVILTEPNHTEPTSQHG